MTRVSGGGRVLTMMQGTARHMTTGLMVLALAAIAGCATPGQKNSAAAPSVRPATVASSAPVGAPLGAGGAAPASGASGATPEVAPGARPDSSTLKPFREVIAGATEMKGLFPLWQKDDKVWIEVPDDRLDKPFFLDRANSSFVKIRADERSASFSVRDHFSTPRLPSIAPVVNPFSPVPPISPPNTPPDARSVFIGFVYNFVALPEPMRPRYADDRVGYFTTNIADYSNDAAPNARTYLVNRFISRLGIDYLDRGEPTGSNKTAFYLPGRVLAIQTAALEHLISDPVARRIGDAENVSSRPRELLTLSQLYGSLQGTIWSELASGKDITRMRRNLQREHLRRVVYTLLQPRRATLSDVRSLQRDNAIALKGSMQRALGSGRLSAESRAHLRESIATIDDALRANLMRTAA